MKKSLLSIAAVAALLGKPALAADMALKAPPMPPPVYDWTGPYVGATLGMSLVIASIATPLPFVPLALTSMVSPVVERSATIGK
jgi:hypothetical protein